MKLEFWGTAQEFRQIQKKYIELADYMTYMGENTSSDDNFKQVYLEMQKDIADMKHIKNDFISLVDKFIKRM